MIREHDRVVLTAPVPDARLEIGDVGTVVHVYADGKAFEIEFDARRPDGRRGHRGVLGSSTRHGPRDYTFA